MKKLVSIFLVIMLLGTQLVFAEEKTSGDGPAHFAFAQLTNLSIENVEKISIACSKEGRTEFSTSSPLIISDIFNTFKDMEFVEDTRDGSAGGWVYGINFYMKDGTYIQFGTRLHIDKADYNAVFPDTALEKMAYYHDLIKNVDSSEWATDYILECQKLGFLEDITDLSYKEPITREKFCEIIYNMLDKTMDIKWKKVSPNPFRDTVNEKIFSLCLEGIIEGKGGYTFAPNDFLVREEAATILMRTAGVIGIGFPENAYDAKIYNDEDLISDWAFSSVHYARKMGVMVGTSKTEFSPKDTYTAEQAIATVIRLYNKYTSK